MNKTTRLVLAVALGSLTIPFTVQALDFNGYVRSGIGESSGSDSQACFQLPEPRQSIASATSASSTPSWGCGRICSRSTTVRC